MSANAYHPTSTYAATIDAGIEAASEAFAILNGVKTWFRRSSVDSAVSSGPLRPRRVHSRRSGSAWVSRSRLGLGATSPSVVSRARANTSNR